MKVLIFNFSTAILIQILPDSFFARELGESISSVTKIVMNLTQFILRPINYPNYLVIRVPGHIETISLLKIIF